MKYPFEVGPRELDTGMDAFVSVICDSLTSEFLELPKGAGFIEYDIFEQAYESLKKATSSFTQMTPALVVPAVLESPVSLVVLRTILGFTPPNGPILPQR